MSTTRLAALVERGRAKAESLMTLELDVYEPTGTGKDADGYDVVEYTKRGRVKGQAQAASRAGGDTQTRYVDVGGVSRPVLVGGLKIPISAALPAAGEQRGIGWEYEVAEVGRVDDPALLGRRYLVVEAPVKSYATARRLDVVEV